VPLLTPSPGQCHPFTGRHLTESARASEDNCFARWLLIPVQANDSTTAREKIRPSAATYEDVRQSAIQGID